LRLHADQLSLSGGAKLAAELGAATADHLEHTDAEGIAALRAAGIGDFIFAGGDALAMLQDAWRRME